ncbi:MAG: hypothetical protein PHR82_04595 [Endomicrobiaceae bacterium]|nr:hypothetical protein [Endomicrobiaceae bacterium]
MKRIISLLLIICLSVNMAFAFDPYAEEEVEKKSSLKLIYGIALTLTGAFLTYDGFSKVEVDVSKPAVDYMTVIHAEWNQSEPDAEEKFVYTFKSGYSGFPTPTIDENIIYNSGNVDLTNVKIEVRYFHVNQDPIVVLIPPRPGDATTDIYGYRTIDTIDLAKGSSITWEDTFAYYAAGTEMPGGTEREADAIDENGGLYRGESTWEIMEIRLDLSDCYTKIYEKRNKSDLEGAAGIVIASAGIYFLADYFIGLKKFDRYMKQNQMNIKLASYPSEYKLLFQKRI